MQTRRQFLRNAGLLPGVFGSLGSMMQSIAKAAAIAPEAGSSFMDAKHVVILMQENRSFDHSFGSLRGVRGFDDPRAIRLADGNPVWVQTNAAGEKFVPYRLDIKQTSTTWMGCLPHGWSDQVDAANGGKHDRWLQVKRSGKREYAHMPLTLGHHTREDIPFYYALADAFTICDQNFCSTLTGTTPNRLHLWTGTSRERPDPNVPAVVRNGDCQYGHWTNWTTFPERLEDVGVTWKCYQNELTVPNGLSDEADAWLANFGDNPLEWFTQYHVRFAKSHQTFLAKRIKSIPGEIESLRKQLDSNTANTDKIRRHIADLETALPRFAKDLADFSAEKFAQLSPRQKSIHQRAFCTNEGDLAYRDLTEMEYIDGKITRKVKVPKGDVLYQFRQDVNSGKLPTISWLSAPERFSDHPCSAWYGQWYLSEVFNILTKNPEVWRKTIFILTYDENDGYFDHVPPFQAPHLTKPNTGKTSVGIDTTLDHLELDVDRRHHPREAVRGNSLGLGFRVPMIIASPWSRGGNVCSQVFDHTSVIQLIEKIATHASGKKVKETNITQWRRTVCGDLTSAFSTDGDSKVDLTFIERDPLIQAIHRAQFNDPPTFHALNEQEIKKVRVGEADSPLPRQEPGVRRSCPLPYQLEVDGELNKQRNQYVIRFAAKKDAFGARAAGSPFIVYATTAEGLTVRHYAVSAGDSIDDSWSLKDFANGPYHFRVHGPNGFFREFTGIAGQAKIDVQVSPKMAAGQRKLTGDLEIVVTNTEKHPCTIGLQLHSYQVERFSTTLSSFESRSFTIPTCDSHGWYDLSIMSDGEPCFEQRYAGRVETGQWSTSDPLIGGAKIT